MWRGLANLNDITLGATMQIDIVGIHARCSPRSSRAFAPTRPSPAHRPRFAGHVSPATTDWDSNGRMLR